MTPQEKAKELVTNMQVEHDIEKQCYYFHMSLESAKRSALIAVNQIVKANPKEDNNKTTSIGYWIEVEYEIQKL